MRRIDTSKEIWPTEAKRIVEPYKGYVYIPDYTDNRRDICLVQICDLQYGSAQYSLHLVWLCHSEDHPKLFRTREIAQNHRAGRGPIEVKDFREDKTDIIALYRLSSGYTEKRQPSLEFRISK